VGLGGVYQATVVKRLEESLMVLDERRDAALELVVEAGLEFIVSDRVVEEVRHVFHAVGQLLVPFVEGAHLGDDLVRRIVGGVVAAIVEEVDEVSGCGWKGSGGCGRGGYPRVTLMDGLGAERRGNGGWNGSKWKLC
jgi:hypothetical protein